MVGPFGGITAAVMLRAIETHPERVGEPLALTVNFTAPIADGDFDVSLRAVRTNRTNQHWIAELSQDGAVTTTGQITRRIAATRPRRTDTAVSVARTMTPNATTTANSRVSRIDEKNVGSEKSLR